MGAKDTAPKRIIVLGSTGSVGVNTLDLIRQNPDRFNIVALTAGKNVDALIAQAREFKPNVAVIADPDCYDQLAEGLNGSGVTAAAGPQALIEAAEQSADLVLAAIVGAAGLAPTLAAVRNCPTVALANKECLVCAGSIFMETVKEYGTTLLPVDSEHSAIFQVFDAALSDSVDRIILTASGGPFREWSLDRMAVATPAEATAHPNWSMGAKISVDSATMMNKGLELIEAHHLFPVAEEKIEILVHPQSVVHSLVGYIDGSVLAQLGLPDMRTPIAYALAWPDRMAVPGERLDLADIASLTFEAPDSKRFPALRLAREALQVGGAAPTILNAANEIAVARFLAGEIGFLDILNTVEETLAQCRNDHPTTLDEVMALDAEARRLAQTWIAVGSAAE
ncbi:MAG: 1-deoxy-D-xylulose-5-phosphate reductoisomerase [Rhodospirillaceae bacterium]|jgi:1-deoxy-D-xylulose-5-phosphate reductoisomerase|nr:1-deoxy-D-xylulose-5-phosphate reductoisomerase [Rhodospirillaceae bacterium]MBT5564162.1 1-deoxy-D-xylulose-5-phosphate reductoisomerase [Rhodospirillaceae bacterium]